jgi:hypothetical protein
LVPYFLVFVHHVVLAGMPICAHHTIRAAPPVAKTTIIWILRKCYFFTAMKSFFEPRKLICHKHYYLHKIE